MDQEIFNLYLKPDLKEGRELSVLHNSESSFRKFVKDLPNIFEREILVYQKDSTLYYLNLKNYKCTISDPSIQHAQFYLRPYELRISYDAELLEKTPDEKGYKIRKLNSKENIENRIPAYTCYKGRSPTGERSVLDDACFGGSFVTGEGMNKYCCNKRHNTNNRPKFKTMDNNVEHMAFNSVPARYTYNYNSQYLTLDLSTGDKFRFDVQSKNTLIPFNIILLIHFLTKYNLSIIKHAILDPFDEKTKRNAEFIFLNSLEIYSDHDDKILTYIESRVATIYPEKNSAERGIEFDIMIKKLFPHLNTNMEKGLYLISIAREFIMASFQTQIYHSRDNAVGKRVMSVGLIFEDIIMNAFNNIILSFKDKVKDSLGDAFKNINFDYITNCFTNTFNMKDIKNSKCIKPSPGLNATNDIRIANQIVHASTISITKTLAARENEPTTLGFEDSIDTPERPENIGLVKSLSVTTSIIHLLRDESLKLDQELGKIIKNHVNGINDTTKPVLCCILSESEFKHTFMTNEEAYSLIDKIKKLKDNRYKNFESIGIEKIPVYYYDESRLIYVPTKQILKLIFHTSSGREAKYFIKVKDGIAKINDLTIDDIKSCEYFSDFLVKYPGVLEYVDQTELVYSVVCVNLKTFNSLPLEEKKLYDYIDLSSSGNFGVSISLNYDQSRLPGHRGIFVANQTKSRVVGGKPHTFNSTEPGSILLNPYERQCVTNNVIEENGLSRIGVGAHCLVAVMSWSDNIEDGLIFRRKTFQAGCLDIVSIVVYRTILKALNLQLPVPGVTNNDYSKLGPDGLPKIGAVLTKNCAWTKNVSIDNNTTISQGYDTSEAVGSNVPLRVLRVISKGADTKTITVVASGLKRPNLGDKFVNQSAQKGTIACFKEDYELPRTADGVVPDIIFNSTSILSRMTITNVIIGLITKVTAMFPTDEDGNLQLRNYPAFSDNDIDELLKNIFDEYKQNLPNLSDEELKDKMYGTETVYNMYGDRLANKVTLIPLMYCRTIHISSDKSAVRSGGKLNKAGVPVGGRKKGGGQRIGSMESDLYATHGVSNILQEVLSDVPNIRVRTKYCENCFTPQTKENILGMVRWYCMICENKNLCPDSNMFGFTKAFKQQWELSRGRAVNMKVKKIPQKNIYSYDAVQ
jgi:DNA-directed RNA polymerase beta subunit